MTCYIYLLKDPDTDAIRYVGKTTDPARRLNAHIGHARAGKKYHVCRWIKSLLDSGKLPIMEIVDEVADEEWESVERYYISALRKSHDLTNISDGGNGVDVVHTPEWIAKIVASRRANGGWILDQEARTKISNTLKKRHDQGCKNGHPWTDENTIIVVNGNSKYRVCRKCKNALQARRRKERGLLKGRSKTHCKIGHLLSGDNLRILQRIRDGVAHEERICRECVRIRNRACKKRKHQARLEKQNARSNSSQR